MILPAACDDVSHVESEDGTRIALHALGGTGAPMLVSHATGFHAHCYEPLVAALASRHRAWGLDHRGFGDSDAADPSTIEWATYGDDALAAAREVSRRNDGAPIVGFGHSMGGATLLMAAQKAPELFRTLFLYEPIVFPPMPPDDGNRPGSPLPEGARRRRSSFPDFAAALENFATKPPMNAFDPRAREAYVRHGFRRTPDGSVELKCLPELEARTYETGGRFPEWNSLRDIATPAWVMSGAAHPHQPSGFTHLVAEMLPASTFVRWDEMGHFGPFTHPDAVAAYVDAVLLSVGS